MLLVSQLPLNFGYSKVSERLMKVQSGILRMTLVGEGNSLYGFWAPR